MSCRLSKRQSTVVSEGAGAQSAFGGMNTRSHIQAFSLDSAFQHRRFSLSMMPLGMTRVAVVLKSGQGHLNLFGQEHLLVAPGLAWLPAMPSASLYFDANVSGDLLMLSNEVVGDAIGKTSTPSQLLAINDRATICNDIDDIGALSDLSHTVAVIKRELVSESYGSWNYLTAHVALLLMQCLRHSGFAGTGLADAAPTSAIMIRFRQQIDMHFRSRWRITDYARELNVSHDRLHDICMRTLGKTPLTLLHDRILREACLRLLRSELSVEGLADYLGFHSPPHFSRFFKQHSGQTPTQYRRKVREAIRRSSTVPISIMSAESAFDRARREFLFNETESGAIDIAQQT